MTQTLVTAVAVALAVIAALEHLPRALTSLVQACVPLVQAWQELVKAAPRTSSAHQKEDEVSRELSDGRASNDEACEVPPSPRGPAESGGKLHTDASQSLEALVDALSESSRVTPTPSQRTEP